MTTIASDGKTVAADGLRCAGDEMVETDCIKIIEAKDHVYGFTGTASYFAPMVEWHKSGALNADCPKTAGDDKGTLLVFSPDHVTAYYVGGGYSETYPYPVAFGSGAGYATTALDCGKSPADAVALAAKRNVYTGGKILTLSIPRASMVQNGFVSSAIASRTVFEPLR